MRRIEDNRWVPHFSTNYVRFVAKTEQVFMERGNLTGHGVCKSQYICFSRDCVVVNIRVI